MTKNLPQSAERAFALMCADAGIACNRSEEDVNGWDFIIEYPARLIENLPRDMTPGGQTCFVQVKSSKKSKSVRIKLSNALRFAQSPAPCFIVLFLADADGSIGDIFVVHFWKDLIGRTLRKVRELEEKGIKAFHKHTITLRFDEKCKVDDPLEYIRQAVDGLGNGYEEAKRKLFQSIGFEDGAVMGHFSLAPGTTLDDLLDHQLGKKERLDLTSFVVHSQRFGIKSPIPLVDASAGILKITPHPLGDCSVVLTFSTTNEQITFFGKIIVPHVPGLPEEKRKIQIVASPIEIILQPASGANLSLQRIFSFSPSLLGSIFGNFFPPFLTHAFGPGFPAHAPQGHGGGVLAVICHLVLDLAGGYPRDHDGALVGVGGALFAFRAFSHSFDTLSKVIGRQQSIALRHLAVSDIF